MYNTMYSAPSLVSNKSTAVSRSFVLKQFQADMPFVSQTNNQLFVWLTKGMFAWHCFKTTSWHCCGLVGNEGGSWVHRVVHPSLAMTIHVNIWCKRWPHAIVFSQTCAVVAVLTVNMGTKQRFSLRLVAKDRENPVVGAKNADRWSR